MLWIEKSFDSYLLSYKSGFVSGSNPLEAAISCYTQQPWQQVGRILFFDGNSVPQNQTYDQDLPSIHFHLRRFSDVMHILLNEKPLYLRLNTNSFYGDIATSTEPIGEEEP